MAGSKEGKQMRRWAVVMAMAVAALTAMRAAADGVRVVGTIVEMQAVESAEGGGGSELRLRVDEAGGEEAPGKPGEVLRVRAAADQVPKAVGMGDQVEAAVEPRAEAGLWQLTETLRRLGRGELVNPGDKATEDLGPPGARVLVKLFAPLAPQCHQKTAQLLRELAGREPERVRVQIFDMMGPEARAEMRRERLSCATVLVNNRLDFRLGSGEENRAVSLSHRPNAPQSTYNSEDVVTVVEQELARLYPEREKAQGEAAEQEAP